jgi:dihydropteroate synthase
MFINCQGELIDLSTPKIMGILNLTPDSFYAGSRVQEIDQALSRADSMLSAGATFIDLGGYSTRPGADDIPEDVEKSRVIPIIEAISKEFPEALISIDTFRSEVAKSAVEAGASIINDISAGLLDESMLEVVADKRVPYIMMHMRGTPITMSQMTDYKNLTEEILYYFSLRIAEARRYGIIDIIADPGFGFAKSVTQNFELLSNFNAFKILGIPLLAGLSRKSMIWKTLGIKAERALNGTTALHMVALAAGANILRVHDVREASECIRLWGALEESISEESS